MRAHQLASLVLVECIALVAWVHMSALKGFFPYRTAQLVRSVHKDIFAPHDRRCPDRAYLGKYVRIQEAYLCLAPWDTMQRPATKIALFAQLAASVHLLLFCL